VREAADGGELFRHTVVVPDSLVDLPRVGVAFSLPGRFDRIRYLGRGPHENYPDRNRSAMLGVWESALDRSPYLVPQEFGLRTECRWFELIDSSSGEVVRIECRRPMHISATRHRPSELFEASTATDLVEGDDVIVCLDAAHRGLGTASCGPDVLPEYRLPAGTYQLEYRLLLR
jgi:beta-galactosidase